MTRAPGAEPVPPGDDATGESPPAPTWSERRGRVVVWARRQRIGLVVLVAAVVAATAIGAAVGRATAPGPETEARRAAEALLLPLAVDADGIWTSSSDDRIPVSQALVELRTDGDPDLVLLHEQRWIDAYDGLIVRIAGTDVPAGARPVQRQLIAAVTLSRDAVEVLGHAAVTDDPVAREDLTIEVARLRQRSEQLIQSARASVVDLDGRRVDVSPLPEISTFTG